MTLGEIFINIGFKITGKKGFDDIEPTVDRTAMKAAKLTVAINAVNWALFAMMTTAGKAGQALVNFNNTTGLSTQTLQFWQHAGVGVGIAADAMTAAIKRLQTTRAEFALGRNDSATTGIWSMLGVDPRQDPVKVIQALRARIATVPESNMGNIRYLLGQIGMEEMLPMLRSTNAEFAKWSKAFVLTDQQAAKLARFNRAWESLKFSIVSVKNQLAAALVPVLDKLARLFEWIAGKVAIFTQWLNKGGAAATVVRRTLQAMLVVVFALGAAMTVLTAGLITLAAAIKGFALLGTAIAVINAPLLLGAAAIALVIAGITALILLLDDFWTAADGGKSFFNWNKGLLLTIDNVNKLAHAMEWVLSLSDKVKNVMPAGLRAPMDIMATSPVAAALATVGGAIYHVDAKINVNEAKTPHETTRVVARTFGEQLRSATNQAPAISR